jgi:hypothetical protein
MGTSTALWAGGEKPPTSTRKSSNCPSSSARLTTRENRFMTPILRKNSSTLSEEPNKWTRWA